jgi:elongation factor Ts
MTAISASAVKELRETTGAGMMDCKRALDETKGNMQEAIDYLRKKGLAQAAKKAGRTAAEGVVAIATSADGKTAAVAEFNSETDFVAKNPEFQTLALELAQAVLDGKEASKADAVTALIAKIGENLVFCRNAKLSVNNGIVATYIHNQVAPGMGKIAVLLGLESTGDKAKLQELGKQLTMHIAAAKPTALTRAEVDGSMLAKEREIFTEQARQQGKPDNVIEKMVEGRIQKFYGEVVLPEQIFVMDNKSKVSDIVAAKAKEIGAEIAISGFQLIILGEGIEKQETDYAAEVAATVAAAAK